MEDSWSPVGSVWSSTYGAGEAYMPVLEALESLCRGHKGEQRVALLRRYAPTWLVQMPALLEPSSRGALQRELFGTTRERMLREATTALEELTARRGLILVLEDLHWSDHSTIELLAVLARRREPARLLVLGTYRPEEVTSRLHPLSGVKHELHMHEYCRELALTRLTEAGVTQYLAACFPDVQFPPAVVHLVCERTDGNPLFLVNVRDHLIAQGVLVYQDGHWTLTCQAAAVTIGLPARIQQLIEVQIARLSPQAQAILEAASVAGMDFSTTAVAAGLREEQEGIEKGCEELARHGRFLRATGVEEWPDGTAATRYEFLHALYQEAFYERVAAGRRVYLHQRIGARFETGYGERAGEIAAALAMHFERGRDFSRAVKYYQQAGENALRRYAHQEAIAHFDTGLTLLRTFPETPEHDQHELQLLLPLGTTFYMTKGPMAPEAEAVYDRACELCICLDVAPQLAPAYAGLTRYYATRGELQTAGKIVDKFLALAQQCPDSWLLPTAHVTQCALRFFAGDFAFARGAAEQVVGSYDVQKHGSLILHIGEEPGILALATQAWALWYLGYSDQATQKCQEANSLTQVIPHPFNIALTHVYAAFLHQLRGEIQEARHRTDALLKLATEQEMPFWLAPGLVHRGWVLVQTGVWDEGVASMRQGLDQLRTLGATIWWVTFQALLGEVYIKASRFDEGQRCLEEAFTKAQEVGEFFHSAELSRLQGELTLQGAKQKTKVESNLQPLAPNTQAGGEQEAEGHFLKAIEVARKQQAKSLELRATVGLCRLWQWQGKKGEGHQMLSEIDQWFTEGFGTRDLQEARALLDTLSEREGVFP